MGEVDLASRLPPPASRPTADALFSLGLKLSTGGGVQHDPVAAQALFELAARFGSLEAKVYRHGLGEEMDPSDIAEARKLASDWLAER
jgi:TPR repeat protein